MAGIAADEGFIEHAPGELIEFFFFDRLEKARADFGGLGHLIQRDFALFAFAFKTLAEGSHLAFSLASVDGPSMYTESSPMLRKEKGLGESRRSRIVGHFGNISNVTSYNFARHCKSFLGAPMRQTRRQFLQTSTFMAAALPLLGAASGNRLPIGFSTLGCPTWEWGKILDFAQANGFSAVELRGLMGSMDLPSRPEFAPDRIEQSKKEVAAHGLKISCVSSSSEMHHKDPAKRAQQLADAHKFIDLASALGAPNVRVFGNKIRSEEHTSELQSHS